MSVLDCDPVSLAKIKVGELYPVVWENEEGEPVLLLIPTKWDASAIVLASSQLQDPEQYAFSLSPLAIVTLLRTDFQFALGASLLGAGWLPHDQFNIPSPSIDEDLLRKKMIASIITKYPSLSTVSE